MKMKTLGMTVVMALCAVPALAETYLINAYKTATSGPWTYYQVDGQGVTNQVDAPAASTPIDGIFMAATTNPGQNRNFTFDSLAIDLHVLDPREYGLTVWLDSTGVSTIGSGGLTMAAGNSWTYGNKMSGGNDVVRVKLSANQTWSGPSSTPWAQFCLGHNYVYGGGNYGYTSVKAEAGVTSWQIDGRLKLFLSGSNQLENVDVTVSKESRLRLIASQIYNNVTYNMHVRLGAKSLTLLGGDTAAPSANLVIGMTNDVISYYSNPQTAPDRFDDYMIAPLVTLDGDVRIMAGTARYGLTRLVAKNGDSTFSGKVLFTAVSPRIEAEDGASFAFTGSVAEAEGVETVLVVAGDGTVSLPADTAVSGVLLDGGNLALSSGETLTVPVSGSGSLTLSGSGYVVAKEGILLGYTGAEILVSSGCLVISSVADIAPGVKIRTEGTGGLFVVDQTGFDVDTHMSGTKKLVESDLIITDDPVESGTLTVGNGEVLAVFGSGLKAGARVQVQDGGAIRFLRTATVYAPVETFGGVTISTDANSVTGTLAGVFTATNIAAAARNVDIVSRGMLRFSSGGTVWSTPNGSSDCLDFRLLGGGNAEITGAPIACRGAFRMLAGTMTVASGGGLLQTYNTSRSFFMSGALSGDVKFVIGEGGTVSLGNNSSLYMGGSSTDYEARMVLDGGTLNFTTADRFYFCYDGYGDTVLEINSGTINTLRVFDRYDASKPGRATILWRGGTIKGADTSITTILNNRAFLTGSGVSMLVDGDCTLDLDRFSKLAVTNASPSGTGSWTGTSRAKLRVLKSSAATRAQKLVLANFAPNGMAIDLNGANGADVEILGADSDLSVTWVAPGTNGVLRAIGTSPALAASYLVPEGVSFDASTLDGWNSGFSSVTHNDLTFMPGSTLLLQTDAEGLFSPISILGSIALSGALSCYVDATAHRPAPMAQVVVSAAGGASGECAWTVSGRNLLVPKSSLSAGAEGLSFVYSDAGLMLILK